MKRLLIAVLIGLMLIPTLAMRPQASGFSWSTNGVQRDYVIELQTVDFSNPVVNPTQSSWDIDDNLSFQGSGRIAPGSSVSYSVSLIADSAYHLWGFKVRVPKTAQYDIRIALSTGQSVPITRVIDAGGSGILLGGCLVGPVYNYFLIDGHYYSPDLLPIPDSNGGYGQPMTVNWIISNLGTGAMRNVGAAGALHFASMSSVTDWCPGANSVDDLLWQGYPAIGSSR